MSTEEPPFEPGDDLLLADQALFEVEGGGVAAPRHLSPSSATLFEQCPRRWRFRYVDRLPDPPGIEALVGTFAHRVLELLLTEPSERRTQARAKDLARQAWPETERNPEYRSLGLDDDGARQFRWRGWHAIEGLWAVEDPSSVQVRSTERQVRAEVGGVPFVGVIDRVDECADGLVVTDYKSGRPPSRRFEDAKLAQVLLYAAALAAADGETPARARLVYLGSRVIETHADPESVDAVVDGLRSTWDGVTEAARSDTFEPRPGPLCGWCPHAAQCPEGLAELQRRHAEGRLRSDAPAAPLVA